MATFDCADLKSWPVDTIEQRRKVWDELHLLGALQGLANRSEPRLYLFLVEPADRFWLDWLRKPGNWLDSTKFEPIQTLDGLVRRFRRCFRGVVLWSEDVPASSNLASTAAGAEDLLPVRLDLSPDSVYTKLVLDPRGPRLPVRLDLTKIELAPKENRVGSAKNNAVRWGVEKWLASGRTNPTKLGYYPDSFWLRQPRGVPPERTLLTNHDYFVAKRGFFFDLGPWDDDVPDDDPNQAIGEDSRTLQLLLHVARKKAGSKAIHVGGFVPWDQKYTDFTGRKHQAVATEWRYAEILSCFNAYMDADAAGLHAMANASVFMHFPLKAKYPQTNLPNEAKMRAMGFLDESGRVVSKPFVSIYVGDYDSAAWLYQMLPKLWTDPVRGLVPLGWAFNPNLEERFPVGLDYTRRTASPKDTFITGDSGAGYLNPGYLEPNRPFSGLPSGLQSWVDHSAPFLSRWDLKVTGFVIDGFASPMSPAVQSAYAQMTPWGVVAQKIPEFSLVDGTPFLRMGSDLAGDNLIMSVNTIASEAARRGPGFRIYRTVLWTPTQHKRLFDLVRRQRPDVEFVEPHTLFWLLKRHLERQP